MRRITGLMLTGIMLVAMCSVLMACKDDKDDKKDKGVVSDGTSTQQDGSTTQQDGNTNPLQDGNTNPLQDGNTNPQQDGNVPAHDHGIKPDLGPFSDAQAGKPNTGAPCAYGTTNLCPSASDSCLKVGSGGPDPVFGMCLAKCTTLQDDAQCPEAGSTGQKSICFLNDTDHGEKYCAYTCTSGEKCPDHSKCVTLPGGTTKVCEQEQ